MSERFTWDFDLEGEADILPTVEVDTGDNNQVAQECLRVIELGLKLLAEVGHPATVYSYESPSVNFGALTHSVWFGVAGPDALLPVLHAALSSVQGARVRYGECIPANRCVPILHVEDGVLWEAAGGDEWRATSEDT